MRQASHLHLERDADLLLYFFGSAARPLRDDLDIVVGNVGVSLDRKVLKSDSAPYQQ